MTCEDACHGNRALLCGSDVPTGTQLLLRMQVLMTMRKEPRGWFVASVPPLTTHQREYTALHKIVRSPVRSCLRRCSLVANACAVAISVYPRG